MRARAPFVSALLLWSTKSNALIRQTNYVITFCLTIREGTKFNNSLESLAKEIINSLEDEDDVKMKPSEIPAEAAETPQIDIKKKPGRAFLHKLTGKFLAESGIKGFWLIKQYEAAAGQTWKRTFIPIVSPINHTNPSRKRSFSKTLFKREQFENAGYLFSCERKTSWKSFSSR